MLLKRWTLDGSQMGSQLDTRYAQPNLGPSHFLKELHHLQQEQKGTKSLQ